MATQPRLVNKQFNSPINLYSKQNVQEVLERETQILANGAIGIDFRNPTVDKPGNLKNSAVLRMLEEEENRQRNGYGPGNEHIARSLRENISWPPPEYEHKNSLRATFKDVVTTGAKRVAWPPPNDAEGETAYSENSPATGKSGPQPQYSAQSPSQQNNYQAASPAVQNPARTPLKPLDITQRGSSPLASPLTNQTPQGFRPTTPGRGWAPVHSPVATPSQPSWQQSSGAHYQTAHQSVTQQTFLGQQYQASQNKALPQYQTPGQQYQTTGQQYQNPGQQFRSPGQQYQTPGQQYQAPGQQYQTPGQQYQTPGQQYQAPGQQYQTPSQQYQAPVQQYQTSPQYQPQSPQYQASSQFSPKSGAASPQVAPSRPVQSRPVEPPPSTITLRAQAPVRQAPPPVVTSQPATATLKGGKHLRGDLKWPPENVKIRENEENRLRLELARGPNFRPKRPNKDYSQFFAQHALNSTYPGYKIPPGTQFFRPE